jgi:hypothetical protein
MAELPIDIFIGEGGRLAGDWRSEALNGLCAVDADSDACALVGDMDTDMDVPKLRRLGDVLKVSLMGEVGGLRAGLPIREAEGSGIATRFTTIDEVKSSLLMGLVIFAGSLIGLLVRGLIGVFSVVASSSSETTSAVEGI